MLLKFFQHVIRTTALVKAPKAVAILSDVLLWLTLGMAVFWGVQYFLDTGKTVGQQVIHLQFRDANEIARGSAVRLMGTDIGTVEDVQVQQDHVAVTLKTYRNTLPIPSGSVFTILFTGLGGAKSIEVELPKLDKMQPESPGKQPIYFTEEPIRMQDAQDAMTNSTKALQRGAENTADFFGKKKSVAALQANIYQARQQVNLAVESLEKTTEPIEMLEAEIHHSAILVQHGLKSIQPNAKRVQKVFSTQKIASALRWKAPLANFSTNRLNPETAATVSQSCKNLNAQLHTMEQFMMATQNPLETCLINTEHWTTLLDTKLTKLEPLQNKNYLLPLQQSHQHINTFNNSLKHLQPKH
jgi:hypothetical protein